MWFLPMCCWNPCNFFPNHQQSKPPELPPHQHSSNPNLESSALECQCLKCLPWNEICCQMLCFGAAVRNKKNQSSPYFLGDFTSPSPRMLKSANKIHLHTEQKHPTGNTKKKSRRSSAWYHCIACREQHHLWRDERRSKNLPLKKMKSFPTILQGQLEL